MEEKKQGSLCLNGATMMDKEMPMQELIHGPLMPLYSFMHLHCCKENFNLRNGFAHASKGQLSLVILKYNNKITLQKSCDFIAMNSI